MRVFIGAGASDTLLKVGGVCALTAGLIGIVTELRVIL